jgi:hypothetical protein
MTTQEPRPRTSRFAAAAIISVAIGWVLFIAAMLLPILFYKAFASGGEPLRSLLSTASVLEGGSALLIVAGLIFGIVSLRAQEPRRRVAITGLVMVGIAALACVVLLALVFLNRL